MADQINVVKTLDLSRNRLHQATSILPFLIHCAHQLKCAGTFHVLDGKHWGGCPTPGRHIPPEVRQTSLTSSSTRRQPNVGCVHWHRTTGRSGCCDVYNADDPRWRGNTAINWRRNSQSRFGRGCYEDQNGTAEGLVSSSDGSAEVLQPICVYPIQPTESCDIFISTNV